MKLKLRNLKESYGATGSKLATGGNKALKELEKESSKNENIKISNEIIRTNTWENLDFESQVHFYFDLAFQTQDKLAVLGEAKYVKENEQIIEKSVNFIKIYKPESIFLASSGAVYGEDLSSTPKPLSTYGRLKLMQELIISNTAAEENINLIIGRLFNLSGRNINKFQTFAIAQMINSAMNQGFIKVLADHQVFRRYSDINQLIRLTLKLLNSKTNVVFDSGGPLIELRELASEIKKIVNPSSKLDYNKIDEQIPADEYYSRSNKYEDLLNEHLREAPIKMSDQILNTFQYMKNINS
jgi:nucleoside-diphosphate-sugar epimerase